MKIFFDIVGCRLNQSEVERLANAFRALGHEIVGEQSEADIAIINTCAVTIKAAADSRKKLRKAGREGVPRVVATGCWATLYPQQASELAGVTDVIPNEQKDYLVSSILNISPEIIDQLHLVRMPLPGDRARTRAFIKVQEGCDNHCTYCLTRVARGKSQSRPLTEIKNDIQAALAGDAKEIVLTGVQLGAWGHDFLKPLCLDNLLSGVLAIEGFERLRLSSIEPWELNPGMMSFWEDARLCRHLHIPLQSGNDRVLKAMGRPITTQAFRTLIDLIRSKIPEIAITTDVIVGFPGETEDEFEMTSNYLREMAFAGGHVFTFSPRPGTAAFNMKGRVPSPIAKARNARLQKLFRESGRAYRDRFVGRVMPVLWESGDHMDDGRWRFSGLTDTYIRVYSESNHDLWNKMKSVELTGHHPQRGALIGRIDKS